MPSFLTLFSPILLRGDRYLNNYVFKNWNALMLFLHSSSQAFWKCVGFLNMGLGFHSYRIQFNTFVGVVAIFVWVKVNQQYSMKTFPTFSITCQRDCTRRVLYMQDQENKPMPRTLLLLLLEQHHHPVFSLIWTKDRQQLEVKGKEIPLKMSPCSTIWTILFEFDTMQHT